MIIFHNILRILKCHTFDPNIILEIKFYELQLPTNIYNTQQSAVNLHPANATAAATSPIMTLTATKPLLLTAAVVLAYAVCALSLKVCPNCGSTPVPYPLSTAPDCGDQLYKIRCNAGSLFFDSVNNTYPITSISPSIQRLTISPAPFLGNTCIASDLPSNGLQLNSSAPFNITGSNTIFYLNCSANIMNSPLNCTSNSLCHVYINGTAGSGCVDAPLCCAFRAGGSTTAYRIRVRDSGCKAYRSFVNLDYGLPVSRWPPPGVELLWVLPIEPTCRTQGDCDSKSTCGPDPNSAGGVSRCFCNSGLQWDPVAGLCATGKALNVAFSIF